MPAALLCDLLDNRAATGPVAAAPDPRPGAFHRSMPGYAASPLADAPRTAAALGLQRLVVKLEVERLGLPSFKLLGASWAACRAVCRRAGRAEPVATFAELRAVAAALPDVGLVTATDGNHGHAVARMARLLGLRAQILVPERTSGARIAAIAGEGARVEVVRGSYDDAVAAAAALAGDDDLVISDTSWPGYEDVPGWVADGYATIFDELAGQLAAQACAPTLVAVQIGVGALASAAVRRLAAPDRLLAGVEPAEAACVLAAVRAGEPVLVRGPHRSIMVGLNCGLASRVALPDMVAGIGVFCSVADAAAERALRLLLGDGLRCGETGVAGVAGLAALHADRPWTALGLPARPVGLAICTEAPTDPASFARIAAAA